jgi:hypothetical protein
MIKRYLSILFALLAFCSAHAQVPNGFNYSAVARNSQGNPIANSSISIQVNILKGSVTGNSVYLENHTISTDQFGLFNLVIGAGSVQSGNMQTIDWSADNYFLEIGMDVTGGNNFTLMGTTQFLSVPYAKYAESAGSVNQGTAFSHHIGEYFEGGIIFHLFRDSSGVERGLIVSLNDLSTFCPWDSTAACASGLCNNVSLCESTWDGRTNSNSIISQIGSNGTAAFLCENYTANGYSDWYLPSVFELNLLWNNVYSVNKSLSRINGARELFFNVYWSSTEQGAQGAFFFSFLVGNISYYDKSTPYWVRAVRSF